MTVNKIFEETGLVDDDTELFIRDSDYRVLAQGSWYQDDILGYGEHEVNSFTWRDENKIYIDVK